MIRNFIIRLVINAVAVYVTAWLLPGISVGDDIGTVLFVALVIGLINAFVKPIVKLLTCPLTILTLGLFIFVINALMLLLAARIVPGFVIAGFAPAFWGAILLAIVNLGIESLLASLKD